MGRETNGTTTVRGRHHVVAMPYPGRGHINPMLNLCSHLLSSQPNLLISFVVTEEWLGFLTSDHHFSPPANLRLIAVPQVVPSEIGRALNFVAFFEAINTKLEDPFESLLDDIQPPATAIIYDFFLPWVVGVGNRRNIPVASLFTQSASVFTVLAHFDLLIQHGHFPLNVEEKGREKVDYIPGLPSTTLAELPAFFVGDGRKVLPRVLEAISVINKVQYLLFTSVYELEKQVIDALKAKLPVPIYPIGPMIPHFKLESNGIREVGANSDDKQSYFHWLDSQPKESVLYISQGSFLSVSSEQMDEIVAGIKESGVRFLWVTRDDSSRFEDGISQMGFLVPWCDQLKVLCHPSVGGFWTHCGWNSTCESIFAGVPMLTCPISVDQVPNSKLIVSDWKIGWRVVNNDHKKSLVTRSEIAQLVRIFMDSNGSARKEIVNRATNLQEIVQRALVTKGSAASNLEDFMRKIS